MARWAARTAKFEWDAAASTRPRPQLPVGVSGLIASLYAIVQVLAARGGATLIELKYHERGDLSSGPVRGKWVLDQGRVTACGVAVAATALTGWRMGNWTQKTLPPPGRARTPLLP